MSSKHEPDIDLYADDSEFNDDEADFNHDGNVDLYDDVIAGPSDEANGENRSSSRDGSSSPHRYSRRRTSNVYIGNLTWWTTDKDIIDGLKNVGITDVVEVKFFENRANGQSKGFCVVAMASEASAMHSIEKFGKKEIHGQTPVVTPYTKQNLNYFENQSRKGGRHERENTNERHGGHQQGRERNDRERDVPVRPRGPQNDRPRNRNDQPYQSHQRPHPQMQQHHHHPPPQGPPPPHQYQGGHAPWMSGPPPQLHQMPPMNRPAMPPAGVPPMPPGIPSIPPPRPGIPPPGNIRLPPPNNLRGPPPPMGPRQLPSPNPRGPPPSHDWERPNVSQPPPQPVGMPPQIGPPARPPPVPNPNQALPGLPPPAPHAPNPHINPAFFHAQGVSPGLVSTSQSDVYNRPPPTQFGDYRPGDRQESSSSSISESEFDEIMTRNRTVSSSAISRAVADASAGDYASAIETLVTAISLIKQSKVANDERCKILISSLQDTLHGIESKSYGSRNKERARSRERERSRERSSRREKSSRRDRSRSRDREYRDRSRERDRYHEDRYRDKDRDHDRDRRSTRH